MGKRSNVLVVLGIAFFVLGVAIVFLLLRDDDDVVAPGADAQTARVLVATQDIPPGTPGSEVLDQGWVELRTIEAGEVEPGALTSRSALAGRTIGVQIPRDAQVTQGRLRSPALREAVISIPDGKEAVAIQVPFVPGVAGYVSQGDFVNLYTVMRSGPGAPVTKLIVHNVEVLDVSTEVAPRAATARDGDQAAGERPAGQQITYLLALDPVQAEQVIFHQSVENLYLSLVPQGAPEVPTPGRTYENAL